MVKLRSRTELKKNIRLICFSFIVLFSIIAVRAYFLGVLRYGELSKRIQNQHKCKIALTPNRGTIYDRNHMELAVSIEVESLFARPHLMKDINDAAKKISSVLETPRSQILKKLNCKKKFVWIERKLNPSRAEKIKSFNIAGLGFVQESQRFYPNKELAGQVLGFAGMDSHGLEGLELEYDSVLKGRTRVMVVERDALGRHLFTEGLKTEDHSEGHDIILTIDKNIQYLAEKELQAAVSISRAKGGTAVVMDPWTGEILAMAIVPLFNPNQFLKSKPEIWRNRAVTDLFEPGSTFKSFLIASALEEKLIKSKDIFFCENGSYRVANRIIHDVHPFGWLSVKKILMHSSNIGASKISRQLGMELFYKYIRKFGFGSETQIQFPSEATGFVPLPYHCSEHTKSAIAFGQGISVTALQLATAYSAIANGGLLMQPSFVKKVLDSSGMVVQENASSFRSRVVSEKTMRAVKDMLKSVVREDGTGEKASVAGFTVAGKTGTSQKTEKRISGYSRKKIIASFAGFVPADRPRLTILVIIDEPEKMAFGGEIAAPVFSRIAQFALNYLHVPPDAPPEKLHSGWKETKIIFPENGQRG